MANLIITVIAIALVAVASLMGAYYGGSAFLKNQSAANASTVLNEGQQIGGAWQAYLNDNNNVAPAGANALIAGGYFAQFPTAPAEPGVAAVPMYLGVKNVSIGGAPASAHYFAYADMGTVAKDPTGDACLHVLKTALGQGAPTTVGSAAQGAIFAANGGDGNGTFGCAKLTGAIASPGLTQAAGAVIPAPGDYVMEYLLE